MEHRGAYKIHKNCCYAIPAWPIEIALLQFKLFEGGSLSLSTTALEAKKKDESLVKKLKKFSRKTKELLFKKNTSLIQWRDLPHLFG